MFSPPLTTNSTHFSITKRGLSEHYQKALSFMSCFDLANRGNCYGALFLFRSGLVFIEYISLRMAAHGIVLYFHRA